MAMWESIPDVIFSTILGHLDIVSQVRVSLTCNAWKRALGHPRVWRTFNYSEKLIWDQLPLSGIPISVEDIKCFKEVHDTLLDFIIQYGKHFRFVNITVKGEHSFEIFKYISQNCTKVCEISIFKEVEKVDYSCDFRTTLYQFFQKNSGIKSVRIKDVNLQEPKNDTLPIHLSHAATLSSLWMINSFQTNTLSSVMYLVNLRELAINPHQMNFSLLKHLVCYSLRDLCIVAGPIMTDVYKESLSNYQWQEIRKCGPDLRVHCYLAISRSWAQRDIFLKQSMPLKSLVYKLNVWLKYLESVSQMMTSHGDTLEEFVDYGMSQAPYIHIQNQNFSERIDGYILRIVKHCPKLTTLAVKEVLSSACLLVMMYMNNNLKYLLIREDMIEYVNDLPEEVYPDSQCARLVESSWQKERFCAAMSELIGTDWKPMGVERYHHHLSMKYSNVW